MDEKEGSGESLQKLELGEGLQLNARVSAWHAEGSHVQSPASPLKSTRQ